jgi:hypothetical protein
MKLNDEDSWKLISKCLKNADWSDESIENISNENLEKIVKEINKNLKKYHKKSSPLTLKAIQSSSALQIWYNLEIMKLAKQFGENDIPFILVLQLLQVLKDKQEQIKKDFINSLEKL